MPKKISIKNKSLGKNAVLNGVKTLLNTLFPLITFPYVSRVLSVNGIGKYNFATSVMQYFLLIAALGVMTYAVREGAKYRDNKEKFEQFAGEVFTINIIAAGISYLLFFPLLFLVPKFHDYRLILLVLSSEILFATIGVEWIYTIYEEFTYITIRSIVIKVISILLLFIFVRREGDYVIYAGITVFVVGGSNLINFLHVKKLCRLRLVWHFDWKKHLIPILIIFASNVASIIYVNSDMTMLGFMTSDYETGIYAVSTKIYKIVKQLLAAVLVVSVPRLSLLMGQKRMEEYRKVASDIFQVLSILLFPSMVGMIGLSRQIVLVIAGEEYLDSVSSLRLLSVALIFCIFEWFFVQCVLLPAKLEKKILAATIISAAINLLLNLFLIPVWKVNAAAFSTVISELLMTVLCMRYGRQYFSPDQKAWKNLGSVLCGSLLVAVVCYTVQLLSFGLALTTVMGILGSVLVYAAVLWIMKNEMFIEGIENIKKRFLVRNGGK